MTTLRPRSPCSIRRETGGFDRYGRPQHSSNRVNTKCAIVWLKDNASETSVRADSSASRGRAEEKIYESRLLFKPTEDILPGDLIAIRLQGSPIEIVVEALSVWRRPDVNGVIHHIQVEGNRWASE